MKKKGIVFLSFVLVLEAQNIDISKFYYRDYLDFGQGYGAFSGNGSPTITGKDGTEFKIPQTPNFSASSNNGNLTAVGRGFAVTANHVVSFTPEYDSTGVYRKFGLTSYKVSGDKDGDSVSQPYGRDEKFTRFDKYVVEGQVDMLDFANSIDTRDTTQENANIQNFKTQLNDFAKDSDGNVYIYQTGSGVITLRNSYSSSTGISRDTNGETRGGGFGTLKQDSINYAKLVYCPSESCENTNVYGMYFTYVPNGDFNNRITTGDSGSGIYAFNQKTNQWVLLGVTSQSTTTNVAYIAAVSNKDLQDYKSKFEQKVDLKITEPNINEWTLTTNNLKYIKRGDTPDKSYTLGKNKDIIFSGNGTMTIRVQENIRLNQDKVGTGGFVFEKANTETTYKFTNANGGGGNYFFKGSGLDIGEKVKVEWALRNQSGDSLHKIGKGELIVKTNYTPTSNENLGYLKIGEGKVTLDTTKKAFEGIYITSGRGELVLVKDKAEALGATKNGTTSANTINSGATSANSYTLAQDSTDKMGFYFGKGGGKFDLAGNSLVLNTIAANDSKAIITNSNTGEAVNLEIQGFGYGADKQKTQNKADTIIHASIGDNTNGANGTNLNLIYKNSKTHNAHLIFDGNININGKLNTTNSNIVLQGHPTTHATISNADTINKIQNAENGTQKPMPDYMDLSKPSTLKQPDWDSRNFNIQQGITLTNATLTVGKAAHLNANITADKTSQINFGGKHFIDSKDGKNVIGSGFSYQQGVTSGELNADELYKDSSYSGTITADGTTITSKFFDFAPNLTLTNGANLSATNLTLNSTNTLNLNGNSSAQVENLIFKDFTNGNFASKFTLNDNSKFEVKKSLSFDKSTLNLDTLKTRNNITLPMAYNLYVFNDSNITATTFTNTKENAKFMLDKSTFTATNGVSFQSAKISVQNGASFNAQNLNFAENSTLVLNDKATLTLENALTSKNLSVNASNQSTFTANTLTASGVVNLNADTNSNIKFSTLNLKNGDLQNISQNVDFTTLNLDKSTAKLDTLGKIQNADLKNSSNLHFNELNFNTNNIKLTSDDSSKAYIKRLIYDALNARANSTNTALQSNIVISEKFELKNVGQNLGQNTQGAQGTPNADDEKLQKDLFTLKFDKNLELGNGASLDISFADKVTKDNKDLLFNKDYTIFSANSLTSSNHLQVDFKNSNGTSFGETDFYIKGKLDKDKNAFSVQFVRENPRNFSELKPHIDPSYSPFLEILLQHNDFDKSVDKAVNLSDYSALQERLISLDKSFKDVANSSSNVLETLPLLQRHNINKRIQNQRFTGAKYAYNEERYNPLQKSDFIPALLYLDKMEKEERVWSNVGGGYFTKDESKMSLQSVSVGYDKKLLSNEFLFGVMASITQMQLSHSADEFKQNPQIYSLTLYSNALFGDDELQNELGFSFFNDKRHIGDEELSAGGVGTFFNSLYKFKLSFLPQNFKPLILANVNFNSLNAIDTPTYIQKPYKDLSFDVGLGFELDFEKENGFYNISFIAQQDIYHSKDEVLVSLAKSDKFIPYKSNDPSLSYQLRLMGLENFNNGMFLRYSLSGFIDTKAYKGVSADIQLGYKY